MMEIIIIIFCHNDFQKIIFSWSLNSNPRGWWWIKIQFDYNFIYLLTLYTQKWIIVRFKNYLKKGSLIKETDQHLWTLIHYAAYHNQYQQIYVLLEIDPSGSNIFDKDRKMTALPLA